MFQKLKVDVRLFSVLFTKSNMYSRLDLGYVLPIMKTAQCKSNTNVHITRASVLNNEKQN